jgi:glucosylglycerate phosphorylase
LKIRREHTAFHPYGFQEVIQTPPEIFGLLRSSLDGGNQVLCLQNVSNREVHWDQHEASGKWTYDLLEDKKLDASNPIRLKPYQTLWLVETKE